MGRSGRDIRIVFMGTPDFAVASAAALHARGVDFAGVVTAPDKPAGRGRRFRESAMKQWARARSIPVLQPVDLNDADFLETLRACRAELFVVVAFRLLPKSVLDIPPRGTINLHASLLPRYRGAAPINWALIQGEKETGVTTFLIDEQMDTGDLLLQRATSISDDETFGELYERLKQMGAELLVETVERYLGGELQPRPQRGEASRAPKLTPELRRIDWSLPALRLHNLIRGLSPIPAAYTRWPGSRRELKIYRSRVAVGTAHSANPGTVLVADTRQGVLRIAAGEGALELLEVQLAGKKRLPIADFLRGHSVEPGMQFE